ncbi:HAD family hydrolase [Winogradskya humida]|uniref:Haloacid dehalogenase n=1 Tax=Winogradskya humida TaxID=113566 RepID=A0ABQ3ZXV9_9ACTN|nr:HAD family hydrolase [Actinoplanes humidus]GIE23426.1 haloacid dehalogenase [Actinoplanes humidus]
MRTDVVVFDIDDTLYLERDYVASGFAAVEAELGIPGFAAAAWNGFLEGRRGTIFDDALAELGVRADVGRLVRAYRDHRPRIELLQDALNAFEELRDLDVDVAFLTDGPRASQSAKVRALDLAAYGSPIVITDELGPGFGKPDPRGFQRIADRTGAQTFAYVADNPSKDFAGPKSLGWSTIRVRRPGGLHHRDASGPDVDVTLTDLTGLTAARAACSA